MDLQFSADSSRTFEIISSESTQLKKEFNSVSSGVARRFLLRKGYFRDNELPEFFAPHFGHIQVSNIASAPSRLLQYTSPKGPYAYRTFGLIQPEHYVRLVKLLTQHKNWREIKRQITKPRRYIACYSLPYLRSDKPNDAAVQINHWLQFAEHNVVALTGIYKFVGLADISTFYPSIYTHSIAWAIHGKTFARQNRNCDKLLGNKIDRVLRNANDGQTNGIPVGNAVSDLIAELILSAIDDEIDDRLSQYHNRSSAHDTSKALQAENSDNRKTQRSEIARPYVYVTRFRDDYRIYGGSLEAINETLLCIAQVLHGWGLSLNEAKTRVEKDMVLSTYRMPKRAFEESFTLQMILRSKEIRISDPRSRRALYEALRVLYVQQEQFPGSGAVVGYLIRLGAAIVGGEHNVRMHTERGLSPAPDREMFLHECISLCLALASKREELTASAARLIDRVVRCYGDEELQKVAVERVSRFARSRRSASSSAIWLYRLLLSLESLAADDLLSCLAHDGNNLARLVISARDGLNSEFHNAGEWKDSWAGASAVQLIDLDILDRVRGQAIPREAVDLFAYPSYGKRSTSV